MITPAYVRTMAAYNAEVNRRWYGAADTLTDAQRREDRGAFFGSLHGTLCHLQLFTGGMLVTWLYLPFSE